MLAFLNYLSKLRMVIIGGIFLALSLTLMLSGIEVPVIGSRPAFPVDPAWLCVFICGLPIMYNAVYYLIKEKTITVAVLITTAMIAAIAIGELFAAGEVAFIMAIGGILEAKTVEKARRGIKKLISLVPEQARKITDEKEEMQPIDEIKIGDIVRVLPGEAIPVDGVILSGNTSIDQSIMTGESLPVDKSVGEEVYCGTINRFGSIDIRVTKIGEDSSLQKLIRLVREAEENKAPMQRIVDKWATWLVPIAIVIAIAVFLITHDIIRAVTILVVFCPCSLALATPTSIMAAIGQATKHGVLIKSGEALERMGKVNMIAFDKTGTLTQGKLMVSDVLSFDQNISEDELLKMVASVEVRSEHPLAKAITAHADEKGLTLFPVSDFQMIPGKGVSAKIKGKIEADAETEAETETEVMEILCGNETYLRENNISLPEEMDQALKKLRAQGKAIILVSYGEKGIGLVALSDILRDYSRKISSDLKAINTDTVLLTGDNSKTAEYFAGQTGIENVYSELLPAQKVERINELQGSGKKICMVGDGVNDAPALKTAYVGVAMGGMGSDIAVEAADIALMSDKIEKIPYLKRLSVACIRLIRFNISLSMSINFIAIILSTLALLNPVSGALVHNVGSILVTLNAALLYDRKI